MRDNYSFGHLSDGALLQVLDSAITAQHRHTAHLIAILAEVDERKLYLPAAYPSMFAYCVGGLGMSEQSAARRIRAARVARAFPGIFEAIADGRLNLTGVLLLKPCLTQETAAELIAAAAGKSKTEIEQMLAERFPRPDLIAWEETPSHDMAVAGPATSLSPATVTTRPTTPETEAPARETPLSAGRVGIQLTVSKRTHDKLRRAQELLSHELPAGEVDRVFDRALDALIAQLEKRKLAATSRPRTPRASKSADSRHIPAHVRRAVWQRDGGQCTFVSEDGRRCQARYRLEFDHIVPVARGGESTVDNIRQRCRAHNQFAAEQTFGTEFMRQKRLAAAERQAAKKRVADDASDDFTRALQTLKYRPDDIRRARAHVGISTDTSLEQRVRAALQFLGRSRGLGRRVEAPVVARVFATPC